MGKYDLCIIGGAGHVGLPLGVAFANRGVSTVLLDINETLLKKINSGIFPFKEKYGDRELKKALKRGTLHTSSDHKVISKSKMVLLVIGTPIDEYLNPDAHTLLEIIKMHLPYFLDGQVVILRSTLYPGTSERLQKVFDQSGKKIHVAFCPERIVQGESLRELLELPQIVSAFDKKTVRRVSELFKNIAPSIVVTEKPIEAELAKLFSNSWRYIKFAVANQFFMIADQYNLDYYRIHDAMVKDYARNKDLPRPGFTAGPCLFKDTMQLAAFNNNNFFLGHAAMLINEGMPNYILQKLKTRVGDTPIGIIGILGMAFKADSDDARDSLSYKLRKIARAHARQVLCHDVHIRDDSFIDIEELLKKSDVVILAAPHKEYGSIKMHEYPDTLFIDIWNFWGTVA
ncbi:nucleotide sugar dehydrogenase [Candidatus Kaiserbacteria bacterium]|nr:nucleotide sugar dehydrogenase [Candidatus Kaiserbacteria bacterium]